MAGPEKYDLSIACYISHERDYGVLGDIANAALANNCQLTVINERLSGVEGAFVHGYDDAPVGDVYIKFPASLDEQYNTLLVDIITDVSRENYPRTAVIMPWKLTKFGQELGIYRQNESPSGISNMMKATATSILEPFGKRLSTEQFMYEANRGGGSGFESMSCLYADTLPFLMTLARESYDIDRILADESSEESQSDFNRSIRILAACNAKYLT